MLSDRGVAVDHTILFRWIQACAGTLEKRMAQAAFVADLSKWRLDIAAFQEFTRSTPEFATEPARDGAAPGLRLACAWGISPVPVLASFQT